MKKAGKRDTLNIINPLDIRTNLNIEDMIFLMCNIKRPLKFTENACPVSTDDDHSADDDSTTNRQN